MKSLVDIKHRITSVKQTRQITGALETISIAKMRKALSKYEASRIFFEKVFESIFEIMSHGGTELNAKYFNKSGGKRAHIVLASDKGLAGGFNDGVLKAASGIIKESSGVIVYPIGLLAAEFFTKKGVEIDDTYVGAAYFPSKKQSEKMADDILERFFSGVYSEVYITYTKLITSSVMEPKTIKLLPFERGNQIKSVMHETFFDPSPNEVLDTLIPMYLKWMIFGTLTESYAAEHSARRFAMSGATKNADGIINDLTLSYNRARQEAITNEITEIITSTLGVLKN